MSGLTGQLVEELDRTLVGPVRSLLGFDLADMLTERIRGRADMWAAILSGDDHEDEAAELVLDLMTTLWPHADPEHVGRADWWRTPLGLAVGRSIGRDDAEAVTHHIAAAILGISRGAVGTMVSRGTLDRHPDGGVLRAAVLQRLAR